MPTAETEVLLSDFELTGHILSKYRNLPQINEGRAKADAEALPHTDMDAAIFIERTFGNLLHYVTTGKTTGDWYTWDDTIHVREPDGKLDGRLVDAFIRGTEKYISEAFKPFIGSEEVVKALEKVRRYLHNIKAYRNAQSLKSRLKFQFTVAPGWVDQDRDWIVWEDGKVTETANPSGPLLDPDPARPVTRKMGVTLGEGEPKRFLAALDNWNLTAEEQQFLKIAAGAALTGRGDAKNIIALVGISNTGKSTYLKTMLGAFGDYGVNLPAGAIVEKTTNFEQHLARGARFIALEEPQKTRTDDSFLKNLAGGGGIVQTQQKGRDVVSWQPQGLLHIGANHVPRIDTRDDAIVKRMNILGFNRTFEAGTGDYRENMDRWLIREDGPRIARWLLDGAVEYNRQGFIPVPDSIKANAASNTTQASAPLRWLMEQFEGDGGRPGTMYDARRTDLKPSNMVVSNNDLYRRFVSWADGQGILPHRIPEKKVWENEISRHMGATGPDVDKRHSGYSRLWNVGWASKVEDTPEALVTMVEPGHGIITAEDA